MSGENKHNSFFPQEDSPISVPPVEEAWSFMRQRLDGLMPVVTAVALVKSTWFLRLSWLVPAAAVACVSVWLVVRKPGGRETGHKRVMKEVRRDAVGVPERPTGLAGRTGVLEGGGEGTVGGGDKAEGITAGGSAGGGAAGGVAGGGAAGGVAAGGGAAGGVAGGGNAGGVTAGGVMAGGSAAEAAVSSAKAAGMKSRQARDSVNTTEEGEVTRSETRGGRVKAGIPAGWGQSGGKSRRRITQMKEVKERPRGIGAQSEGVMQRPGEAASADSARVGAEAQPHHQLHRGMASVPPLAIVGSNQGSTLPGRLSSFPARGVTAKVLRGQRGFGDQQAAGHHSECILAAGLWDGQNFAVSGQVVYRYTSSDGSGTVPDHLPGAYLRMYMGDRVFIDAGLRLYSPQYTRLQRIDSTGDTTGVSVSGVVVTDTIVTLEKLYYTDLPLVIHYRIAAGLYLGAGIQYSRLWGGAAAQDISRRGTFDLDLKNQPGALAVIRKSDWRVLLDAGYMWRRLSLGVRYQQATGTYLRISEEGSKPRNSALNLYLSYDIWRQRRKK